MALNYNLSPPLITFLKTLTTIMRMFLNYLGMKTELLKLSMKSCRGGLRVLLHIIKWWNIMLSLTALNFHIITRNVPIQVIQATIRYLPFILINVYAHNSGTEQVR